MQLGKIGTHVRKGFQSFTGKMFETISINKNREIKPKPYKPLNLKFNTPNGIIEKALLETEIEKSQAIMFARVFQNR